MLLYLVEYNAIANVEPVEMPMSISNSNEYDWARNVATTNREGGRPASVTGSEDEESGQQVVLL